MKEITVSMKYFNFLFVGLFLTFLACKTSKNPPTSTATTGSTTMTKTVATPPASTVLTATSILQKMVANGIDFERMSGDAGIDYKGKPMNISVSSGIRWRRDSVIWLNVKKMGFNVARAQITRDSAFVINYLQSSYAAKNISYVEQNFGVPLDFVMLQDILLGNAVFLTDKNKLTFEKSPEGDFILRGSDQRWKAVYRIDATNFSVKEMLFEEPAAKRSLKIVYKNYAILRVPNQGEKNFSYLRTIDMESAQTGKVSVELEVDAESLEVNVPKNIRFEIPSNYQRMD
jgi:Domain of unknown function (DUF4292)